MAYKDRMIASRSIAAAVREARIEMKRAADGPAKGGVRTKKSSRFATEVRTALDAAIDALKEAGFDDDAKVITDAMWNSDLEEVNNAIDEVLGQEGGDELPQEVSDARYAVESAMNGGDEKSTKGRPSALPAPHRRGVPTSARLREAVRRDLSRGETKRAKGAGYDTYDALVTVFGDEVEGLLDTEIAALEDELKATMASEDLEAIAAAELMAEQIGDSNSLRSYLENLMAGKSTPRTEAKAAGSTEADALMQELADQAGKLMELEAPDKLWNSWDDDERDGWNRLASAASAVYDEALSGNASAAALSRTLAKLENVLADLQDYVQVDAEEMAGVDLDDMMEIADQYLEEEGKSAGDSVATKGSGGDVYVTFDDSESWEDEWDAIAQAAGEYASYSGARLEGDGAIVEFDDPEDAQNFVDDFPLSDYRHVERIGLKSAGDSVARKASATSQWLVVVDLNDDFSEQEMAEVLGILKASEGTQDEVDEGYVSYRFDDEDEANRVLEEVASLPGVAGAEVVPSASFKGSPSSTRTKKSELDGALADIQYDVAQINRVVDAEDDGSAEMEAWKAAYNTWVSTAESATDEDPTEGLPDALDALVEAATDLQGHYIDQDMVDSLMSAIDSYNSIVTRSASDVTTKASSLSDVEERLGAAMNAMGKAASAADKASAETEDPDEADAASALSELCSDIAGDLQATDADDRDGIQGLMDQITEIEITIRDEAAAEQVGTFTEKARAALEEALELLSAYEGKSAAGSNPSTRTKNSWEDVGDRFDAVVADIHDANPGDLDLSPEMDEAATLADSILYQMNSGGLADWEQIANDLDELSSLLEDAGEKQLMKVVDAFQMEAEGYAETQAGDEVKSYSAASRAKRREALDTKRAGEGELEALEADYTTFAREYNAAVQAALTEAQALADGDADEEADQLEAEIEELFIGESLAETPMRSGESYPWDEIASALREVMKWTSLTDAAQASLAEAQSILEQFDGDSWWEQYSEELEARYT